MQTVRLGSFPGGGSSTIRGHSRATEDPGRRRRRAHPRDHRVRARRGRLRDGRGRELRGSNGGRRAAIAGEILESVLSSLLDNARQHGGGNARATIALDTSPSGATIRVADDGDGISPANAAKIFDPFFTTARDDGGTGLGLTIARSLLAAHGGTIEFVPSARGATFVIVLP